MVSSQAKTVEEYLDELPPERRAVVEAVRAVVRANLPAGYAERVNWGMLSYEVPLEVYPNTYNQQPLNYVGLAAQKNYYSLYLSAVYASPQLEMRLRAAFAAADKKLDMGKACVRFKKLADLPLEAVGEIIAAVPLEEFVRLYTRSRER